MKKITNKDKSIIFVYAWKLYKQKKYDTFSRALKTSWRKAKSLQDYNQFVLHTKNKYFNFVLSRLNNERDISEECLNDAFVCFAKKYNEINPIIASPKTYFHTVLKNMIIDYQRKYFNKNRVENNSNSYDNSENGFNLQTTDFADDNIQRKELMNMINYAKSKIQPKYKKAIELVIFNGYQYNQAAEILNVPINTVKIHVMRGKEQMKEIISKIQTSEFAV